MQVLLDLCQGKVDWTPSDIDPVEYKTEYEHG